MGLLARFSASTKKGYISEFLDLVLAPHLDLVIKKRIKFVTNAGGLDPMGLKAAIEHHLRKQGRDGELKVAAVYGDNILPERHRLQTEGAFESFDPLSGAGRKEARIEESGKLLSLNAYTGAEPITEALRQGADIVVTGRCVDSALVLGPLAYEYGWAYSNRNLDLLASASLAGHVIECGAQATGGNFTDWKTSASSPHGGWCNMGYPILTFKEDGTFSISKPKGTGGVVSCNSVCEQMLYEVLDPENYVLPDVVVDMSQVRLQQLGTGEDSTVTVRGAKGKPPTPWLKCTAVEQKGHRISVDILVCGEEAESKAKTLGKAIIDRTNFLVAKTFKDEESPIPEEDMAIHLIGNESSLGSHDRLPERREIALRVAARHKSRKVLDILSKEAAPFLTSSCPGICLLTSGRPKASPNFVATSTLVRREKVLPMISVTGSSTINVPLSVDGCRPVKAAIGRIEACDGLLLAASKLGISKMRLHDIAVGRSGDKGDTANIAIIARDPSHYQLILDQVTPQAIYSCFRHFIAEGGTVTRFEVPGVSAVNFVLTRSLGGGGLSSLRLDRYVLSSVQ